MKTLHVIPNFEQSAITRELDLLLSAPGLEHFVCCLGADGPISSAWRADGNSVRVLNSKRWLDPRSIWQLADAIRTFQPDAIQSWGLCSLRAVLLTSRKSNACIAVRKAIPPERSLSAFERWLLRRADRVLARSRSEAARCVAAGVPAHKLFNVTPGVREVSQAHQIIKPLILCLGSLHPHRGFYDAIWAFDILHYAHNDLEIAIVGEGPDRRRLERLASSMRSPADIHLPGKTSDVDSWLARASVVWVTSLSDSGITTTLEAMSAGKPVIAYRRPSLAEFIVDGETGLLVEPSNKMALASQTLRLLQSPAHLLSFGEAGRRRVRAHYSPQMFLDAWMSAVKVSNSKIAPARVHPLFSAKPLMLPALESRCTRKQGSVSSVCGRLSMNMRSLLLTTVLCVPFHGAIAQSVYFPVYSRTDIPSAAEDAVIATLRSDANEFARLQAALMLGESGVCTKYAMEALLSVACGTTDDGYPAEASPRVRTQALHSLQACLRLISQAPPTASSALITASANRPLTSYYTIEVAKQTEADVVLHVGRFLAENLSTRTQVVSAFDQVMFIPQPLGNAASGTTAPWPMLGKPVANRIPPVVLRALPPELRWGQ